MSPRDKEPNVTELRNAIAALTGHKPAVHDRKRLAAMLADLQRNVIVSVSMPAYAKFAAVDLARSSKCGVGERGGMSELVRRALVEYANNHGELELALVIGGPQ